MKPLRSLRRAIFGPRKVASIVSQFSVMVEDLKHTCDTYRKQATAKRRQSYELAVAAEGHHQAAEQAQVTANRISQLIS